MSSVVEGRQSDMSRDILPISSGVALKQESECPEVTCLSEHTAKSL